MTTVWYVIGILETVKYKNTKFLSLQHMFRQKCLSLSVTKPVLTLNNVGFIHHVSLSLLFSNFFPFHVTCTWLVLTCVRCLYHSYVSYSIVKSNSYCYIAGIVFPNSEHSLSKTFFLPKVSSRQHCKIYDVRG